MFTRIMDSTWTENHPHPLYCPTQLFEQWTEEGAVETILQNLLDMLSASSDFPNTRPQLTLEHGKSNFILEYGMIGHTSGLIITLQKT